MSKVFKIINPKHRAHREQRITLYRERARAAISAEGNPIADDMVEWLAVAAWQLEGGAFPQIMRPGAAAETVKALKRLQGEGKRLADSIDQLAGQINGGHHWLHDEIRTALAERGIDEETVNTVFEALEAAGRRTEKNPIPPSLAATVEQGRNPSPRSAWVLNAWPLLSQANVSMKGAGRILSMVFDGNNGAAETIYQAIRNNLAR